MSLSNLDLVKDCDSFPYYHEDPDFYDPKKENFYQFRIQDYEYALGYVTPDVAQQFVGVLHWDVNEEDRIVYLTGGSDVKTRSEVVMQYFLAVKKIKYYKVLDKWRDELYPVYGKNKELLFNVERSASPLLGVVTYGVHLTAFVRTKEEELKIWIPRRAKTKQTYGGMLDNAVAGGIASGEDPFECLVRECGEEASLQEDLVRSRAKPCGAVTYFHIRTKQAGGETGLLQPECQYVYDLELPEDVIPKPGDDEVEQFYLWSVPEVQEAMARGEFKNNCALIMLDFFVRHGILTAGNEKDYIEIVSRLHRRLEFPTL